MQAIRQYATVHDNTLIIHLPEGLNEQKVEVIVLPVEEDKSFQSEKRPSFKGRIQTKMTESDIETQLKTLRGEWDRPTL